MSRPEKQSEFTVDDLPRFSPWPERLLGLVEWRARKKTAAEVAREFDREKWGSMLARYQASGATEGIDVVDGWALEGLAPSLCSIGGRLELLEAREALQRHYAVIAATLRQLLPASALVELGAGYGSALFRLAADPSFRGLPLVAGEYTRSGIELLRLIAVASKIDVRVGHCDLGSTPLTELSLPEGSIIFTSMAAHYIPWLEEGFVEGFVALRPKAVVHFEPCYEHCDAQTLIGALRLRYIQLNDYNRNLSTLLHDQQRSGRLRILTEEPAVIGCNPLLPISVLAWRPIAKPT